MNNRISLKDELFTQAIADADLAMQQLIEKMISRGAEEGKLSLTIKLNITEDEETDGLTGEVQVLHQPHMLYKVAYSVPDTETMSGALPTAGTKITASRFGFDIEEIKTNQTTMWEGEADD